MAAQEKLNDLADRKRLLIAQADLHRALLQAECARVGAQLQWLDSLRARVRSSPWVLASGAAGLGVLAVRNWRRTLKWIPAAVGAWRWFNRLK